MQKDAWIQFNVPCVFITSLKHSGPGQPRSEPGGSDPVPRPTWKGGERGHSNIQGPAGPFKNKNTMQIRMVFLFLTRARDGTRTRGLDLGKVALHQLSHSRISLSVYFRQTHNILYYRMPCLSIQKLKKLSKNNMKKNSKKCKKELLFCDNYFIILIT